MSAPTPTKPGFYWAKWKIAENGTKDEHDFRPLHNWEVVEVFVNCTDESDPEYLRVFVGGVSRTQSIENFYWGPGPFQEPRA